MITPIDNIRDLPIMVDGIIYRVINNSYEVLCLKRSKGDGGWWQPMIGHVKSNESIMQALMRELNEETSITSPLHVVEDIWHFHWEYMGEMYIEFVFGIEVLVEQNIILNPEEHEEFKWRSYEDAVSLFKYENNKNALRKFDELFKKREAI